MNVAPELEAHLRPIEELIPLPDNPRQGDVGAISQSLARFGQLKPIVIDEDGVILAGNHTYYAAVALGWTEVAAVVAPLDGQEKTAFSLADNRLSDLASYDTDLLISQLSGLTHLDGTGYDYDDLDDLVALSQEAFTADGIGTELTVAERQRLREEARAAGMEIRSLVILLGREQFEWAVGILRREADTHSEALLSILAAHSDTPTP